MPEVRKTISKSELKELRASWRAQLAARRKYLLKLFCPDVDSAEQMRILMADARGRMAQYDPRLRFYGLEPGDE